MKLTEIIENGGIDGLMGELYSTDDFCNAVERLSTLIESYRGRFGGSEGAMLFSTPGRTEIGGNHTDHNNGWVLAGAVNLDMAAVAAPADSGIATIRSDGFPEFSVDLSTLEPVASETATSAALVRGVAAAMKKDGWKIGGFNACVASNVLKGSGLSSSAAFEVLIGCMLSHLYNGGNAAAEKLARYGQYAENEYFGKPCGLMDQMAVAVGGFVSIDFKEPSEPRIEAINFDLSMARHQLCIVDVGADHEELTDEYAAIPREMRDVAALYGKSVLREIYHGQLRADISRIREKCGDRALLRALHFFMENERAMDEATALRQGDFSRFLSLVNSSGRSSAMYLQNMSVSGEHRSQPVAVALCVSEMLLGGKGAVRVHGGGFAGTVQAIVPDSLLNDYRAGIEAVFGEGSCHVLQIRKQGAVRLA